MHNILSADVQASPFWDANMFHRFQERLGGKVRFIISGGAPLALKVEEFLMTVLCCPVLQVSPAPGCQNTTWHIAEWFLDMAGLAAQSQLSHTMQFIHCTFAL